MHSILILFPPSFIHYTGSDIIQTVMIHENDVNSDDLNRISVDVDQTDGLKSRLISEHENNDLFNIFSLSKMFQITFFSLRIQRAAQTDSGNYSCKI